MMRTPLNVSWAANVSRCAAALSEIARKLLRCPTHACKQCANRQLGTSVGGQRSSSSSGPTPSPLLSLPGCVS
eukprot:4943376-Amphidinium_carterae.1